jgi:hypothetical protein
MKMKAFYDIARVVSLRTAAIIALMKEAVCTSETSVCSNVTTRRYIPDGYVHNVLVLLHNFKVLKNKSIPLQPCRRQGGEELASTHS